LSLRAFLFCNFFILSLLEAVKRPLNKEPKAKRTPRLGESGLSKKPAELSVFFDKNKKKLIGKSLY